jgi:hypothetical protein
MGLAQDHGMIQAFSPDPDTARATNAKVVA